MLELLRKRLSVVITLVTLMLSALFLARGTTSLIAGAVLPIEAGAKPASRSRGAALEPAPGSQVPDFTTILKRNMFDPTTGPLWPPPPEEPAVDPEAEVAEVDTLAPGQLPPACEGSARLIAAVYSERHPEWSFASITEGSNAPLLYRQGSTFADKQVDAIFPKAVFLRAGNGRLCSVGMFNELPAAGPNAPPPTPTAAPTPPRVPTGAAVSKTGGISNEELDQNIRQASDTKFSVQRGLVDKILENQGEIMRSARIVPHEQNGQVVGVKLYGIRRNSLLGKLGLQNGDLLQSINGYNMASPDSALEAYSRLRSASNLSVMVTRRGKPMTVEYTIE